MLFWWLRIRRPGSNLGRSPDLKIGWGSVSLCIIMPTLRNRKSPFWKMIRILRSTRGSIGLVLSSQSSSWFCWSRNWLVTGRRRSDVLRVYLCSTTKPNTSSSCACWSHAERKSSLTRRRSPKSPTVTLNLF